jgi:hypothetical protein
MSAVCSAGGTAVAYSGWPDGCFLSTLCVLSPPRVDTFMCVQFWQKDILLGSCNIALHVFCCLRQKGQVPNMHGSYKAVWV